LTSRACLFLLALLSLGTVAAAPLGGFSLQSSFGMGSIFNQTLNDDFWNVYTPGFSDDVEFPWFDWTFNESYNLGDMYSHYSEYYVSSTPIVTGIISTPVKFEITKRTPSRVHMSSGKQVSYNQYAASATRGNELWIQGSAGPSQIEWSQSVVCPAGTGLQLVAFVPAGGQADFFETIQTNSVNASSKRYNFYSGYNDMQFTANQIGRHILLFVVNNQPSNAIIVDVISPAPPAVQASQGAGQASYTGAMPPANQQYATGGQLTGSQSYAGGYSQTTSSSGTAQSTSFQYSKYTSAQASSPSPVPVPQPTPVQTAGDTPVRIQSQGMRGYQVFLDENYIGQEGTNGDPLDGVFNFKVIGGQYHDVRVYDGQFNYPNRINFPKGVLKIIYVEPGTAVHLPS
jgi:hypothetical protein